MNRVGLNIVLGTFWILVAIWMYMSGSNSMPSIAILVILGLMFYWAAFKIFQNPNLMKKNKKNLIQQMTTPDLKNNKKKK